jgi:hypothetical protein
MPRLRVTSQVKSNLDLWLNDLFLRDGHFTNISVGETDIYGHNLSQLISVADEDYAMGQVWQSHFKGWVWESGIAPSDTGVSPPVLASGATINGVFWSRASGLHIDYPNGRVILDTPIATGGTVYATFSYKAVLVDFADTFENETKDFYVETSRKDNPWQTGLLSYPLKNQRTLPIVMIDLRSRQNAAYELGSASNVAEIRGSFHIWARDSYMKDIVEDLVEQQEHTTLFGIDFNLAPQPLDYYGDKNGAWTSYSAFAYETSPYLFKRIYIDELNQITENAWFNIERGRINFLIRVYPNF